jgi:hypothetical protein
MLLIDTLLTGYRKSKSSKYKVVCASALCIILYEFLLIELVKHFRLIYSATINVQPGTGFQNYHLFKDEPG